MKSISLRIYFALISVYAVLAALNLYLPQGIPIPPNQLPASRFVTALAAAGIVFVLYGGLGLIGLLLAKRLGFAGIWDERVTNRQRFLIPAYIGISLGIFFIITDTIISKLHAFGPLPHPPFPTSITASISAGIGEEAIFRLFFISFWIWLTSSVILRGKYQNLIFWIIAIFSGLAFAAGHFPSIMMLFGLTSISQIPPILISEIILLNGTLSLFAAYYFRKYGYLAAVSIHFWADIVWHVIWGLFV